MSSLPGKVAILSIVGLSLAMAGFAWWHRYESTRRCLEFWTPPTAKLIARAPRIEWLEVEPETATDEVAKVNAVAKEGEVLTTKHGRWRVVEHFDISRQPGVVHARNALLEDASFVWRDREPLVKDALWKYGIRFSNGADQATVLFAPSEKLLLHLGPDSVVCAGDTLVLGFDRKREEWRKSRTPAGSEHQQKKESQ